MDYLPLFYQVTDKPCLVVGGGEVATRKASMLLRAGARLRVVATAFEPAMDELLAAAGSERLQRQYQSQDLEGMALVIAATDDDVLNSQVSQEAGAHNIPVNVVDNPALCSFILPSIVDRSPLVMAISSGGQSPVLARMIRAKLESTIPAGYGRLAALVGRFRDQAKARFADVNQRRGFWERVLEGPVAELVFAGREQEAESRLQQQLAEITTAELPRGEVYLVGAGPGDPDLLTFRALRLMQQADVVLYDRLVSPEVLELVRRDAERIYVGKARSNHALPQNQINDSLVELAREGRRVCRLKGGDPFIFGRGGEEIDRLAQAGIQFQVVPGITAASGCASYAGIPLTHRDHAQSVRFVTGHLKDGTLDLDWNTLAKPRQTLVFYMGLVGLPVICEQLIGHGLPAETPIALVQQGTTRYQKVWTSTLEQMPKLIANEEVRPPTLIIVGTVVSLHQQLAWFEPAATASGN
ncbi:MAG: uroporphyrinogen-III C-methyltransferase [Pseudomonadales bacterium]|nr:uroporphyrinogen-III C-methyltransferase [Pseudomonadales bacterium]